MKQWTGSKLGKEYVKAAYCQYAYFTFMENTSCEMLDWMKHKLESRWPGEITITSDMQMIWLRGESICLQGRRPGFNPWVRKIPWRRKWQPTPVFLPGESHGRRSLVGYSPWGHKESDTTDRLHFHFHHPYGRK